MARVSIARRQGAFCIFFVFVAGWQLHANAAQLSYALGYEAQRSSNIHQADEDRRLEWLNMVFAQVAYDDITPSIEQRLRLGLAYRDYKRDELRDRSDNTLDGYGRWNIVPQTLSWVLADNYREVLLDATLPDTPENREKSNVAMTGPDVNLRLGALDRVAVEGRYADVYVSNSNLDNVRSLGAARWTHQLSPYARFGADYQYMDVRFEDSAANIDFNRHDAFVTGGLGNAATQLTLELGRSRVNREEGEPLEGDHGRIGLISQFTSTSHAGVRYSREFSDTGLELLRSSETLPPIFGGAPSEALTDVVTGEVFYTTQVELFYRQTGSAVPWNIEYLERDVDFAEQGEDRRERRGLLGLNYPITRTTTFFLALRRQMTEFSLSEREDVDDEARAALFYRLSRHTGARLEFLRLERDSSAAGADFEENRAIFTISYGVGSLVGATYGRARQRH